MDPRSFGFGTEEPLSIDVSSPPCVDWSVRGKQQGAAGPSEPSHWTYLAKRKSAAKARLEHLYFFECTRRYPIHEQVAFLDETHDIVHITWSPCQGGFPTNRKRLYAAGVARWSHVWVGPSTAADVQADFEASFSRGLILNGDCYLHHDPVLHEADLQKKALGTAFKKLPPSWRTMCFDELLPYILSPSALGRFTAWHTHRKAQINSRLSAGSAFLFDLDQNSDHGEGGSLFPTQTRHHSIYSCSSQVFATDVDCWAALGLDCSEAFAAGRGLSPVYKAMRTHTSKQQQQLRGNSMHVPTVAAWLVYVMSNMVAREAASPQGLSLVQVCESSSSDDEGCLE